MKRNEALFLAIGGLETTRLERSENATMRRKPFRRSLLIAAVALLLLLMGCAVAVYTKIHTKVVLHEVPTATVSQDDSTEVGRDESAEVRNVLTDCYPQVLPAGYAMVGGDPIDRTSRNITYSNAEEEEILFVISTSRTMDGILVSPKETSDVTISGRSGIMQISDDGERAICWQDEENGYYAGLCTADTTVDLQALAESVAFGQRLPLSFLCKEGAIWDPWYPQQLPDGYAQSQVSFATDSLIIDYSSEDNSITYVASPTNDLSSTVLDPPHDAFTWTVESIGGMPGKMMTTSGGLRILLWENTQEGFYAMLSTMDENVDILAMAESTAAGEQLSESPNYLGPDYTIEISQDQDTYYGWESMYPQAVPEGYTIRFVSDRAYGQQDIVYENDAGNFLRFIFYYRLGPYGRSFDGMGQPETVDINGNTGYQQDGALLWTDESKGYAFSLLTDGDLDLTAIARSVAAGPELEPNNAPKVAQALEELGDYRITALPAGMEEDSFTACPLEDGSDWYAYVRRWYFQKDTGREIFLSYETYLSDGTASLETMVQMQIGTDEPAESYTIQGCPAAGAIVGEIVKKSEVVWIQGTPEKGMIFHLSSADYSVEELAEIAQSVQKQ